jgi:predicted nuclease of restriction endonuclease-like (RecB) superfamily
LNKCSHQEERSFYIIKAATEFWSVSVLEHRIDSSLFEKGGTLSNNFVKALPVELKPSAVQFFNDE